MSLPISVCLLTKNSAQTLARCLDSVSKYFTDIIVVDTGSTDQTLDILKHYPVKLFHFTWVNDFSQARNFAAQKAGYDLIFALDSDEVITSLDEAKLKTLLKQNPQALGQMKRYSLLANHTKRLETVTRIYNRQVFFWQGTVHEQIVPKNKQAFSHVDLPLTLDHYGYQDEIAQQKKAKTYQKMLEAEIKKKPDSYLYFQLGKSFDIQAEYQKAVTTYTKALPQINPKFAYFRICLDNLCFDLLKLNQAQKAAELVNHYGYPFADADGYFLFGHIYMNLGNFQEAVNSFLKATTFKEASQPGANSWASFYNIGVIYEVLGQLDLAKQYYLKCPNYPQAVSRLQQLK